MLETAERLPGISPLGYDPSHGAPYEYFAYDRGGALIGMIVTYAGDTDLALGLIFTEGQEPSAPGPMEVDGRTVIVYPPNSQGTSAVVLEGVCGQFDLWASWPSPDTATIAEDVAWVANEADCPLG